MAGGNHPASAAGEVANCRGRRARRPVGAATSCAGCANAARIFAVDYCLIEPSPMRRSWQEKTLARHSSNVRWAGDFGQLAPHRVTGVIFSNELLDAMPATASAGRRRTEWLEWRVDLRGEGFVWQMASAVQEAARRPAAPSRRSGSRAARTDLSSNFPPPPPLVVPRRRQPGKRQTPDAGLWA